MSIDDRIRVATEAFGATVREVRTLVLPDAAPAPVPRARPRWTHARRGWLIPLAAAIAVIAVAATLVAVRSLSAPAGPQAGTRARGRAAAVRRRTHQDNGEAPAQMGLGKRRRFQPERHRHADRQAAGPGQASSGRRFRGA